MAEGLDVLVIGGGLAGLSAAYRLQQRSPDLKVLVLEANDRVGGRTLTIPVTGPEGQQDAFDLGGHWVCKKQKDIMELVEEFDIEVYPQNVQGTKVMQVGPQDAIRTYTSEIPSIGSLSGLVEMQLLINQVEALAKQVDIADPYSSPLAQQLDGQTVETLMKAHTSHQVVLDVFNAAMQSSLGCDCANISALFFLAYGNAAGGVMNLFLVDNEAAQEFRVKGGTQQFSLNLVERIGQDKVLLGHAVKTIKQKDEAFAQVECDNGKVFRAKRIIVTAPCNIVAKNFTFEPELPREQQRLYENMHMGNLVKVFTLYETSFWLEDGFSGEVVSTGGPSYVRGCEKGPCAIFFDATTALGTPAFVGFIAGKNADQWMSKSKADLKAAVMCQLESYFGSRIRAELQQYYVKDWADEPHIRGGPVNYCCPGTMHDFFMLRKPHGQVHFAGTATSTEWCGYLSGAVQSGYRAAAEVLKVLDPKALNEQDKRLIAKAHPKQGFPLNKVEWKDKIEHAGYLPSKKFMLGLLFGVLFMRHKHRILYNVTRLFCK